LNNPAIGIGNCKDREEDIAYTSSPDNDALMLSVKHGEDSTKNLNCCCEYKD